VIFAIDVGSNEREREREGEREREREREGVHATLCLDVAACSFRDHVKAASKGEAKTVARAA